jgi:hypothetical protein
MPLRDDQRVTIRGDVLFRVLDGEAVLLDLVSGTYFGLDPVGTEIWGMLGDGATIGEIRAAIVARYDVDAATARADLEDLVADLVKRGLVEVSA